MLRHPMSLALVCLNFSWVPVIAPASFQTTVVLCARPSCPRFSPGTEHRESIVGFLGRWKDEASGRAGDAIIGKTNGVR
ncbi:hypothetical protein QBC45DRAFT_402782 [Copromyces sp. CBS 386.78]|nr:hypothetical protein QBC45DRAFT_402782 [Copromyces sp. CBS 386.78]